MRCPDYDMIKSMGEGDYHVADERFIVRVCLGQKNTIFFECPICTKYVNKDRSPRNRKKTVYHLYENTYFQHEEMDENMLYDLGCHRPKCKKNPFQKEYKFHLYYIPTQ